MVLSSVTVSAHSDKANVAQREDIILSILGEEMNSLWRPMIVEGFVSYIESSKSTKFSGRDFA